MSNPLIQLIDILCQIILVFLFLRIFIAPRSRFFSPVHAGIIQCSEPFLRLTRGFFNPRLSKGYDLSPLLPILLLLTLQGGLVSFLAGEKLFVSEFFTFSGFLNTLLQVYGAVIIITSLSPGYVTNPIISFLRLMSSPFVSLLRKFMQFRSSVWEILALPLVLLCYVLAQTLLVFIFTFGGESMEGVMGSYLFGGLGLLINLSSFFVVVIIINAFMSWVSPDPHNPLVQLIGMMSYPFTAPFQRILPSMGGIDFSPIAAILLLQFFNSFAHSLLQQL